MYIPHNLKDNKVYAHDVNSLYPATMSEGMNMPVISYKNNFITRGQFTPRPLGNGAREGNIRLAFTKAFGFLKQP